MYSEDISYKRKYDPRLKISMEKFLHFHFNVLLHNDIKNRSHKFLSGIQLLSVFEVLLLNFINSPSEMNEYESLKIENLLQLYSLKSLLSKERCYL